MRVDALSSEVKEINEKNVSVCVCVCRVTAGGCFGGEAKQSHAQQNVK